jgi:hypothetical protein
MVPGWLLVRVAMSDPASGIATGMASAVFAGGCAAASDFVALVLAQPAVQSRQSAEAAVIAAARFMDRLRA